MSSIYSDESDQLSSNQQEEEDMSSIYYDENDPFSSNQEEEEDMSSEYDQLSSNQEEEEDMSSEYDQLGSNHDEEEDMNSVSYFDKYDQLRSNHQDEEAEMSFRLYFEKIYVQLCSIQEEAPWAVQVLGRLELLQMNIGFLNMFCICLETWHYPTTADEQRLASMITHLEVIWKKERKGQRQSILSRLTETWPAHVQHFHSLAFELEGNIYQSKLQIGVWCKILVHYSSIERNSSTFYIIQDFLRNIQWNMKNLSSYRVKNIIPIFKKQVGILKKKMVFLDELLGDTDNREATENLLQFENFVSDFANSAACLTCLYWANEVNEEISTEMNIVLFDMLQKFIPFAPDIVPLYLCTLKSYNLQASDSSLLGEAVGGFIDLFFEHLATILKDDFLILRGRLIFLFTFLTEPHRENAQEEEDLIRSQIYALFREDAYLIKPHDEINRDFLDNKMLLSDCMIKIEKTSANIRQLYCGFSDSWIRLEVEKMDYIYFVSIQRVLSSIDKHAQWADLVRDQLQLYKMELRFLRVFLLSFVTWDDSNEEDRVRLSSIIITLQEIWGNEEEKGPLDARLLTKLTGDVTDWHLLALELQGKIHLSKIEIEAWCVNLIHWSFRCKASTSNKILDFMDSILHHLNDLVSYRAAGKIVSFKKQIETLEDKLVFLRNMLKLTANCTYSKELKEFYMFVQAFANDAACLTFQYWAKQANNGEKGTEINLMLSHMVQKIKPASLDVARLYFGTLKSLYLQRSDSLLFGQTALTFVDLFLEDLVIPLKNKFQVLRDNIILLLTFLNDPPNGNSEESVCIQIDALLEGVCGILPFDDVESDFSKKKVILSDFMMQTETINANIKQHYYKFPDLSLFNFPKVISPRFLDFLIQNLRNLKARMISDRKYVPFAKYKIIKVEVELVALCPLFNQIFDLQSELKDTWLQVVNLLYLTEHIICSCLSSWFVFNYPIWYHMACLSDVIDRIEAVNTKLKKMKENNMYNVGCPPRSAGLISTLSEQAKTSKTNEVVVVGFEDEAEKITSMLIWGDKSLDTVSIVGMGGLGKTTLARKVYGSSLVKCNFDIFAFCSVSQDHNTRKLLFNILFDIMGTDDKISNMTEDDLAHKLWQCLSRQKYLIVLDDIWDASVWNKVKSSFPDDKNGSRVMFTTRSREVAVKCKIHCIPHHLRFLSEVESWELLQKKVFRDDISPPNLYKIGHMIVKNCKGLPLAVAVIAGLLDRTDRSLSSWSEIAEKVGSYLSSEGCMDILELSYTHLPMYLKPCLLYLGAFPEDELIRAKEVMLLWIAEGFVQESETKSLEDVAKEYFRDLVDRSLVIVSGRSSTGEIKIIRVHDLIHDLCQSKCREGKFFQVTRGSNIVNPSLENHYRLSLQKKSDSTLRSKPSLQMKMKNYVRDGSELLLPNTRSLLIFSGLDDKYRRYTLFEGLKLTQVLHLEKALDEYDVKKLDTLIHLRYIKVSLESIPTSISNMWNIQSLIVEKRGFTTEVYIPETLWRMKTLRHVKVTRCKLTFSDEHDEHEEACPQLEKVVSFSSPILSTGKDVEQLLQRLPAVRELSCVLNNSLDSNEERVETLDFYQKLESLKLKQQLGNRSGLTYLINFPSTLKKLTIERLQLPWTAISSIAELQCLQALKLRRNTFPGPTLEMEDVAFPSLEFFELNDDHLLQWDASVESFPCLEQLLIKCEKLEELPACFGEISTIKKIDVRYSAKVQSSALQIQEEQMELGKQVEVSI